MSFRFSLSVAALATVLSGCAGQNQSLTALLGGQTAGETGSTTPAIRNDPTARAFQVGTASARAVKCGFHFDPAKLRANFLAAEAAAGTPPETLPAVEKNYDVSFSVLQKTVANETNYCTELKTRHIKADLNRHLAGDFTPGPPPPKEQEEEGLFSVGGNTVVTDF
jgi:hypothetical protein